jgi:hypothetical protein
VVARSASHNGGGSFQVYGLRERKGACVQSNVLQSIVSVEGGQVHAHFWNKNAAYWHTGVQKVCRFIPTQQGCVSVAQQRCTITSLLHRVAASTLDASVHLLLPVLQQLRHELGSMGYPPTIFDQSFRSFVHTQQEHSSHAAWRALWRKVQAMCSSGPRGG